MKEEPILIEENRSKLIRGPYFDYKKHRISFNYGLPIYDHV